LDGHSLSIADVVAVARRDVPVAIAPQALAAVTASRRTVEAAVARGDTIYGVNTGFGKLAHVRIKPEQARELQRNLIRSHASGVGEPLPRDAVRAMMVLRANVLVRGTSGVRPDLPALIVGMLNAGAHRPRGGRDEPRGGAGHARSIRRQNPRRAPLSIPAALRGAVARAPRRLGDPRVAPGGRPARAGRVLAPVHPSGARRGGRGARI